jgi:uncharacterized protein YdhG (YjbR/CyaY superfamily)
MNDARKISTKSKPNKSASEGFSDAERAAIKERAAELKAAGRGRGAKGAAAESAVLSKIAELPQPDRGLAERLHAIITTEAPALSPKLWYGMPAYARDGQVVCFFQDAAKFSSRYATLGFNDPAHLDDGAMWPTAYALVELGEAEEVAIRALLKKAVS